MADKALVQDLLNYVKENYRGDRKIRVPFSLRPPEPIDTSWLNATYPKNIYYSTQGNDIDIDYDVDDKKAYARNDYSQPKQFGLKAFVKRKLGPSFTQEINNFMIKKHLNPVDIYKPVDMDRRLFSKIMQNKNYQPSKSTAVKIALGLKLNYEETQELLNSAGFTLSKGILADVIIEYCIRHGKPDFYFINELFLDFSIMSYWTDYLG
jgi:hypothetical protein